ncbi:MAG: hypothetical protein HPY52_09705 [Firmicutes bacterium]|nr:hypothetical protein [Bacillota bacterium]
MRRKLKQMPIGIDSFKNVYTFSSKTAEEAAREALQQIESRRYDGGIKNIGVKERSHCGH